jgi:hypothetical protein
LPGLAPGVKTEAKTIRSAREPSDEHSQTRKVRPGLGRRACQANHSGGRQQEATRAQALLGPGDGRGHSPEGRKSFCIWVGASEAAALGRRAGHIRRSPPSRRNQQSVSRGRVVDAPAVKLGGPGSRAESIAVDGLTDVPLPVAEDTAQKRRTDWRALSLRPPDERLGFEIQTPLEHALAGAWSCRGPFPGVDGRRKE